TCAVDQSTNRPSVLSQAYCERMEMRANGLTDRSVLGRRRKNSSALADTKNDNSDWLAAQISKLHVAEVVACTGMTEKAVQNIRRGKSKLNFDNQTELFRAHPELGAAYMVHIGLLLPGEAETAAAYTRFANAAIRQRGAP